ncbi:hypothetical protein [Microbaculum marinum]|uniref:Uncharacterized protein n=1 Tax=Microbaculum marinum TaxID=1764581 RepID=A0AAW9RGL9_9HYPH
MTKPFLAGICAALASLTAAPAEAAVVYCTSPGLPVGCVARPVVRAAPVVQPGGVGSGIGVLPGAGAGAAGVGLAPGVGVGAPGAAPVNLGGPVNRAGRR